MSTQDRVPLFINRFSLSPRTSIGVQTRRLSEAHADWLETQLALISQLGEAHYLAQQIRA